MQVRVRMLAFGEGEIRTVDVPDRPVSSVEQNLDDAYVYGQNEINPLPLPSVSIGDVIELPSGLFIVRPLGFGSLTESEFEQYRRIPRRDRSWSSYARPEMEE